MLPDFQGLQSHFNLDSVSKTYQSLKESTELFLIRPVRERVEAGVQFLRNVIDGEKQTEEEVHVNDDSEDYTPGKTDMTSPLFLTNDRICFSTVFPFDLHLI
jgi:hypothetical protein